MDQFPKFFRLGAVGPLQPKSSKISIVLLVTACCVFATTIGYDSGLINGINIMPQYTSWFKLTTVTKSLNTSASYIGWFIAAFLMGPIVNSIGRKGGILVSVLLKLIGIAVMTAATSVPMFVVGRIILGWAKGTAAIAGSTWLAETLPAHVRGIGLSLTFSVFYVGALLGAGICYGTANIEGSASWRIPCAFMAVFSIICACVLWGTPESPRWLLYCGREEEAIDVLASLYANGDRNHPSVTKQHQEILAGIQTERETYSLSYIEMVRTANARKRMLLALSVAVISMLSGNNIVSYYLGDMLTQAGIYNTRVKLQIGIVLNSWCLVCAMTGTYFMDKAGRKVLTLLACTMMTITLFLVGALTKFFGHGGDVSGVYATVAMIFLFQGSYSIGITPITQLYPPEVLNFSIRANGMAAWVFVVNVCGLLSTFAMPIALSAIGWQLYMINGAWNALQVLFVAVFWVETKGLSLEDIDRLMDGKKALGGRGTEEVVGDVLEGCSPEEYDVKEVGSETITKVKGDRE
ncbi:unnamed protein product [Clonostachys rosea]|uniref:Major facilitator superfamily (MFS) profile domain-containing protein n=1 Tax=Bionectria ochroleuca TaxID=29856 RepID=A0ABY6TS26_BIOOC|nr:unnamed protein product [Clonostachys rosea]